MSSSTFKTGGGLIHARFGGKVEGAAPVTTVMAKKKCGWCGQVGHGGRPSIQVRRERCKAFKHTCETCSGIGHYGPMCRSKKKSDQNLGAKGKGSQKKEENFSELDVRGWGRKRRKTLPHTAYDIYKGWIATRPQGHPELPLQAALSVSGYQQLGIPQLKVSHRKVDTKSLPDTGAQMTVVGMNFMHSLGIKKSKLIPLSRGVNAANNSKLGLLGGALVEFSGKDCSGQMRTSRPTTLIVSTFQDQAVWTWA